MLTEEIEKLALSLPGTQENAHFGARDFRVGKRIFMTLPEAGRAVFKFTPDQQRMLLEMEPASAPPFPAAGAHAAGHHSISSVPTTNSFASPWKPHGAMSRREASSPRTAVTDGDGAAHFMDTQSRCSTLRRALIGRLPADL